jgi:hypothetical protein
LYLQVGDDIDPRLTLPSDSVTFAAGPSNQRDSDKNNKLDEPGSSAIDAFVDVSTAQAPRAALRLNTMYPSHAASIRLLQLDAYRGAYQKVLLVRIGIRVRADLLSSENITTPDVAHWLGMAGDRTYQNAVTLYNKAKIGLDWLRMRGATDEQSAFDLEVLRFLMEGPINPVPLDRKERGLGEIHDDIATDRALAMSALELGAMVAPYKELSRASKRHR